MAQMWVSMWSLSWARSCTSQRFPTSCFIYGIFLRTISLLNLVLSNSEEHTQIMGSQVILKTKRHQASMLPLWGGWGCIVVLVWLGFAILITLFATLPPGNSEHISVCERRKSGVDRTNNDSQYVLGIVYRVFVTTVAGIIALLFVIFGSWIMAMLANLGRDKFLGALKVLLFTTHHVCCCC